MFNSVALLLTLSSQVSSFAPLQPRTQHNVFDSVIDNTKNIVRPQRYRNCESTKRHMCGLIAAIDNIWNENKLTQADLLEFDDVPLLNDYDKDANENEVLVNTSKKLHHRGPDGMTVANGLLGKDLPTKARWAMGHTRLAIVDPNNRKADMPFQLDFEVEGKKKVIKLAANGEIYNHQKVYSNLVENDGWNHDRISQSDCEVIAHSFAKNGGPATAKALDGMFAFVIFEENETDGTLKAFAARDPVGIKPLYYGRKSASDDVSAASSYVFSSELKALVGQVDPSTVVAIPPGHYWTPEEGLVCFYNPDWLRKVSYIYFTVKDNFPKRIFYLILLFFVSFTNRMIMLHGRKRTIRSLMTKSEKHLLQQSRKE